MTVVNHRYSEVFPLPAKTIDATRHLSYAACMGIRLRTWIGWSLVWVGASAFGYPLSHYRSQLRVEGESPREASARAQQLARARSSELRGLLVSENPPNFAPMKDTSQWRYDVFQAQSRRDSTGTKALHDLFFASLGTQPEVGQLREECRAMDAQSLLRLTKLLRIHFEQREPFEKAPAKNLPESSRRQRNLLKSFLMQTRPSLKDVLGEIYQVDSVDRAVVQLRFRRGTEKFKVNLLNLVSYRLGRLSVYQDLLECYQEWLQSPDVAGAPAFNRTRELAASLLKSPVTRLQEHLNQQARGFKGLASSDLDYLADLMLQLRVYDTPLSYETRSIEDPKAWVAAWRGLPIPSPRESLWQAWEQEGNVAPSLVGLVWFQGRHKSEVEDAPWFQETELDVRFYRGENLRLGELESSLGID